MGWTSLVRTMLAQQPHWAAMAVLQWAAMDAPAATEDDGAAGDGGGDGAVDAEDEGEAEEAEEGEEEEEDEAEWQGFAGQEEDGEGDEEEEAEEEEEGEEEEEEGAGRVFVLLPEPPRGSFAAAAPKGVVGADDDCVD